MGIKDSLRRIAVKNYRKVQPVAVALLSVGGLVTGVQSAVAGTINGACMQDRFGSKLGCTANDVSVAGVKKDGNGNPIISPTQCIAGSTFDLTATFQIVTTATTKYDIGIYFANDGDPNKDGAKTGACSLTTLPKGPSPYLDRDGDFCGDTSSSTSPLDHPITISGVVCADPDGDGFLNLPNAVSWQQTGTAVCSSEADAFPGTTSKCKLDIGFNVPVRVEKVNLQVTKSAFPTSVDEPGGPVTFTVTVKNPATSISVTVDKIVDDPDNDPLTSNDVTYPATSCAKQTLGPGESTTCSFQRTVTGTPGLSFTDKACVNGKDSNTPQNPVSGCATASVSIKDVIPTATVEKKLEKAVCAILRYDVKVNNTDTVEPLHLTQIIDDTFGDVTTVQGDLSRTDCVPGDIAASSSYQCTFDAKVCNLPHTNKVTGTLQDNEGNTITPFGSATVNTVTLP
jgi:hypothetical protein